MKILYCAFVRLPTEKAHGVQIMKTCEAFVEEGVSVDLLIPNRKTHITEDAFEYYETKKSFSLIKVPIPDFVKWGSIGFAFSALWFSEVIKWKKVFWHADIIYSRDAFILFQYILLGRKLVYEGHTKPTLISKFVAKHAYKLIVISEGLKDAYVAAGISEGKITIAHDAIDPTPFKKYFDKKESREWLNIPQDKKVALYVGKIDEAKGAHVFAATSEKVPGDTLCVLIGPESLEKKKWEEKYPKALFLKETLYRDLPRVLAAADILVLPNSTKDENSSRYTSPLKAFAYLATTKPIVASDVASLRNVVGKDAMYVVPDDVSALSAGIESALTAPLRTSRIYSWGMRAGRIQSALIT